MKVSVCASWLDNMSFITEVNGHKIVLDAESSVGGQDKGPPPKPLMLVSLAGCTGMDVISILKKMRINIKDLKITVQGDLTDEHPKHFYKIHTIYEFTGDNLPLDKLKRAIELSEERYCGVSAVYKKVIKMTSEIRIVNSHTPKP